MGSSHAENRRPIIVWDWFHQALVLTSEPDERLLRKLSNSLCAVLISPELSAEPNSESSVVNELTLELLDEVLVEVVLDALSRLVTAS